MEFPDFACKQVEGAFVGHEAVYEYLRDYADNFQLLPLIKVTRKCYINHITKQINTSNYSSTIKYCTLKEPKVCGR